MAGAAVILNTGCKNDMESRIAGKYEHPDLLGQTFEFGENHHYVKTMQAGTIDCTIEYPGTWTVEGDSLFVENSTEELIFHFGDSVTEEQKDIIRKLAESELGQQLAFKIVGVDSLALSLERNDRITTYTRIKQ